MLNNSRFMITLMCLSAGFLTLTIQSSPIVQKISIPASADALIASPEVLDLGEGLSGEKLNGHLYLTNSTDTPLSFIIRPSCGCSRLSPQAGTVNPRSVKEVEVELLLLSYPGSRRTSKLVISSGRGMKNLQTVTLTGQSRELLKITPSTAVIKYSLMKGPDLNEIPPLEFTLQSDEEQVTKSLDKIQAISTTGPLKISSRREQNKLILSVPSRIQVLQAPRNGEIRITLPGDPRTAQIPITFVDDSPIILYPTTLSASAIPTASPSQTPDSKGAIVTIISRDGRPVGDIDISDDGFLLTLLTSNPTDQIRRYTISHIASSSRSEEAQKLYVLNRQRNVSLPLSIR